MDHQDIVVIITNIAAVATTVVTMVATVFKVFKKLDKRLEILDDTNVRARRIELNQRMNYDWGKGKDFEIVARLFDEYDKMGGNSYIEDMFVRYKKSFAGKIERNK